jgi:hypothetical protein
VRFFQHEEHEEIEGHEESLPIWIILVPFTIFVFFVLKEECPSRTAAPHAANGYLPSAFSSAVANWNSMKSFSLVATHLAKRSAAPVLSPFSSRLMPA